MKKLHANCKSLREFERSKQAQDVNHKMVFTNVLAPLVQQLKLKDDQPVPANKTKVYNLLQLNNQQNLDRDFYSKYTVTEPECLVDQASSADEINSAKALSVNSNVMKRSEELMQAHE